MTPEAMRELAAQTCESGAGDTLSNDDCCRANAQAIRAIPIPPAAAHDVNQVDPEMLAVANRASDKYLREQGIAQKFTEHPIVQNWLDGNNDAGGCIAELERELRAANARADEWQSTAKKDSRAYRSAVRYADEQTIKANAAEQSLAAAQKDRDLWRAEWEKISETAKHLQESLAAERQRVAELVDVLTQLVWLHDRPQLTAEHIESIEYRNQLMKEALIQARVALKGKMG